jgi:FkbM family methyltransferase
MTFMLRSRMFQAFTSRLKQFLLEHGIHVGKSINSDETKLVLDSLSRNGIDTVLDVGANSGQFAMRLLKSEFVGSILSFEPDPKVFAKLKRSCMGYKNWHGENCAVVGEVDLSGNVVLNVASNSGFSSSLRTPTELLNQTYGHIKFVEKIEVEAVSINTILEKISSSSVFLKADVQGSERDIFQGLNFELFKNIKGILLEVSHIEIYEGEWLFSDALDFFHSQGFHLSAFSMEDYSRETGAIQSNLIFERSIYEKD